MHPPILPPFLSPAPPTSRRSRRYQMVPPQRPVNQIGTQIQWEFIWNGFLFCLTPDVRWTGPMINLETAALPVLRACCTSAPCINHKSVCMRELLLAVDRKESGNEQNICPTLFIFPRLLLLQTAGSCQKVSY